MRKLIKEPLLHFIVLGALLYLASMLWSDNQAQTQHIIVSEGKIKHLTTLFNKTWQREPSKQELENLVHEYVLEQAAYYEGINLGLDKNDIVIVRRIRQKLDFIAEENMPRPEATDQRLTVFLHENADKFRLEPVLTIRQIYLDPKNYDSDIKQDAKRLLAQLIAKPAQDISSLGDRYLFKPVYKKQRLLELERLFGKKFTQLLNTLTAGSWHGPIYSSFGLHLVYIEDKQNGLLPDLKQIRSIVLREWENSLRNQSTKQYYDELLKRYPATIHWPSQTRI